MSKFTVGRFERMLAKIAPELALRRVNAQHKLFSYDAAMRSDSRTGSGNIGDSAAEDPRHHAQRVQMMWDARDIADNISIVKSVLAKVATYTIGNLVYNPKMQDPDKNTQYRKWLSAWMEEADIGRRFHFNDLAELAVISQDRDGDDGFICRTHDKRFCLVPIEADRIGNPMEYRVDREYVSGVHIDPNIGAPTGYRIFDRIGVGRYENPRDIDAGQFLHVYDTSRFDQYRGVTAFHTVIPTLRDIADIVGYEKVGVKWASSVTGVIVTNTGYFKKGDGTEDFFREVENGKTVDKLDVALGEIRAVGQGQDVKFPTSSRPTAAWQGFLQFLIRDIAMGVDLPYGFIYDLAGLGGPTARVELAQLGRCIKRRQRKLSFRFLNPAKNRAIAFAVATGALPPDPDQFVGDWSFAPIPTIDNGRDTNANLAANRQGLMTAEAIFGEESLPWEEQQEQLAREAANKLRLSKKYNVPVSMISMMATSGQANNEPMVTEGQPGSAQAADLQQEVKQNFPSEETQFKLRQIAEEKSFIAAELKNLEPRSEEAEFFRTRLEELDGRSKALTGS